ncbi:MAG TPA: PadR family transcriptional regulator [Polyangiales bacterium]|nr:PadR family transcriptional regulator [Polyangiales bacterium]
MVSVSGLEELVLMVISAGRGRAYGVSIFDALQAAGAGSSLGAIYAALERLENQSLIDSELGAASASRGGRRKRLFRMTTRGKAALAESTAIRKRLRMPQPRTA